MQQKAKLLVLLGFLGNMGRELINGDDMSACVVFGVGYAFAPDKSVVDILMSKEDSFNT